MSTTSGVTRKAVKHVVSSKIETAPVQHNKGIWITQDELNNHKIEAFEKGKNKIFDDYKRIENRNLSAAKVLCETIFFALKKTAKVETEFLYLRECDIFNFDCIVVIPEKDFLSEASYRLACKIAYDISMQSQKESIRLTFHFMSDDKYINIDSLRSDGYLYSFSFKHTVKKVKNG